MVSLRYTSPSGCVLLDNTLEEWPSHGARLSLQFPALVLQQRLVQNQRAQTGRCLWCPLLAPPAAPLPCERFMLFCVPMKHTCTPLF